jgi:hypothetical protein
VENAIIGCSKTHINSTALPHANSMTRRPRPIRDDIRRSALRHPFYAKVSRERAAPAMRSPIVQQAQKRERRLSDGLSIKHLRPSLPETPITGGLGRATTPRLTIPP